MFLSVFPVFALGANYEELYKGSLVLAKDTSYSPAVLKHVSHGRESIHTVEYAPGGYIVPKADYGSVLYGRSTINARMSALQSTGYDVVAGINGDFFSLTTGLPMGLVITDGIVRSSDDNFNAIGFRADGSAIIGKPEIRTSLKINSSGQEIQIDHINKLRSANGLYLLTPDFSKDMRSSGLGTSVFLKVNEGSLKIGAPISATVTDIITTDINMAIPEDTYVLTTTSTGPVARLGFLNIGDEVSISVGAAPDWENVTEAVGGGDILISGGEITANLDKTAHPRTAVGVKANGNVVLFSVDGRQPGFSGGMSLPDVAAYLKDMGCVSAINLDGGGSTSFALKYPGEQSAKVVNSPSDGIQRTCANFLFLINTSSPTPGISNLHLYPYDVVMLKGSSVDLVAKASDRNYKTVAVSGTPSFSISDSRIAAIDSSGRLTAKEAGVVIANASLSGVSGSSKVTVISNVDSISVLNESSGAAVTSLSVDPLGTINLKAAATYKLLPVTAADSSYKWEVSGNVGTITQNGEFSASQFLGAKGNITVSYGDKSVIIPVTVGSAPILLDSFESGASNWHFDAAGSSLGAFGKVSATTDLSKVILGRSSMVLDYDLTNTGALSSWAQFSTTLNISGSQKYITLRVTGDGSGNEMHVVTKDSGGSKMSHLITKLDFTGTNFFTISTDSAKTLSSIVISGAGKGTLTVDQIVATSSASEDLTHPVISISAPAIDPVSGLTIVEGTVSDNNAALIKSRIWLYLDGAAISDYSYDEITYKFRAIISPTQNDRHVLSVEASDASGNLSKKSLTFVSGNAASYGFKDIASHWAADYIDYIAHAGLVSGEIDDNTGDVYYRPERNMNRAEFAKVMSNYLGFEPSAYSGIELPFTDLKSIPDWALPYIRALYANSVMNGKDTGTGVLYFDPLAPISRQEIMTTIGKTLKKGYGGSGLDFKDKGSIASWALPYVEPLVAIGVVGGYEDGTIRPTALAKRSEVAKMLVTLM